jgi:hypothetical protein
MNCRSRQEQHADWDAFTKEGDAECGAKTPAFLRTEKSEFWVGQNVLDMDGFSFENGSTTDRSSIDFHGESLHVIGIFGSKAAERDVMKLIVLETCDVSLIRMAKSRGRFD